MRLGDVLSEHRPKRAMALVVEGGDFVEGVPKVPAPESPHPRSAHSAPGESSQTADSEQGLFSFNMSSAG